MENSGRRCCMRRLRRTNARLQVKTVTFWVNKLPQGRSFLLLSRALLAHRRLHRHPKNSFCTVLFRQWNRLSITSIPTKLFGERRTNRGGAMGNRGLSYTSRHRLLSGAGGGLRKRSSRREEKAQADAGELVHQRMTGVSRAALRSRAHLCRQPLFPTFGFARAAGPDHGPKERSAGKPTCRMRSAVKHSAKFESLAVSDRK